MKKVSVIINTFNRRDVLLQTLESVFCQDYPNYEVLIVDDGSSDGTREALEEAIRLRKVRYLSTSHLGVAASRNRGIEATTGELVSILDSDIICKTQWLSKVAAVFEEDARIGVVGTLPYEGDWLPQAGILEGLGSYTGNRTDDVHTVGGGVMTLSRRILAKVGTLDERMFFGWEDSEFCWRAVMSGFRVVYLNDVLTFHMRERSEKSRLPYSAFVYESLKNKLLAHLKVAPLRILIRCLVHELGRSVKRCLLEPKLASAIAGAWLWNMQRLRGSWQSRARIYGAGGDRAKTLAALIARDKEDDRLYARYKKEFEGRIGVKN